MRSAYPAMRKIKFLIERSPFGEGDFDANFWPTLISHNHQDTVQVLELLRKKYTVRTSNAMIAAAWRTDEPDRVVRVLMKDPLFTVSTSTISAMIQEVDRNNVNRPALQHLLSYTTSDFVDSDLIAESLRNQRYCRLLLSKHGAPKQLYITERKILGLLNARSHTGYTVYSLFDLSKSLADYLRAGGRLAITERVLDSMLQHDFTSALQLWRSQTALEFYAMVRLCLKVENFGYRTQNQVLDFWLRDGPAEFDEAFSIFEMRKSANRQSEYQYTHFWEVLLTLILNGDRSRFESVYARLGEHKVPLEAVERLCAAVIVREARQEEDVEPSNLFNYVADQFAPVILGPSFFQAVKEMSKRFGSTPWGLLTKENWLALLNSPIDIEWDVLAEEVMLSCEPFELAPEVMKLLGKEFILTESVVVAAIKSQSALLKLEFMWQHHNSMPVTMRMIEAAARTTIVEVLDFLMA